MNVALDILKPALAIRKQKRENLLANLAVLNAGIERINHELVDNAFDIIELEKAIRAIENDKNP